MQFLLDPAGIRLGLAAWIFLLILCVLLPVGAVRQHRLLARGGFDVTRLRIYASGLTTHAGLLFLVWLVMRGETLSLLAPYRPLEWHVVIGAASLALGVVPFLRGVAGDGLAARRTQLIAPRTPREFGMFYALSISAGFAEQLAYRGVLFTLLAALAGSWWLAAAGSAACFGIAHLFQGWRSAGIAGLIGMRDQIVVGLTGTLWVAIVVHILHDAIAGTVLGRRARREEADIERRRRELAPAEATHAVS